MEGGASQAGSLGHRKCHHASLSQKQTPLTHSATNLLFNLWVLQGLLCGLWFLFAMAYAHLYIKDPGEMWEYVYRVPETR